MYPTLLEIPLPFSIFGAEYIPIHSYGLLIAAGFLVVLAFIQRQCRYAGINPDIVSNAAVYSLILGVLGTRLLYLFQYSHQFSWNEPGEWFAIWNGGLVFQGGPPVVLVFLWFYFRWHKIDFWRMADIVVPFVPLGHAFGRLGCFMNGCCYGKVTDTFLGIPFRRVPYNLEEPATGSAPYLDHLHSGLIEQSAHWSLPIYPTQLFSSGGLLLMCFFFIMLRRRWHPFRGYLLPVYFMVYGVFRFFIEFLRGDGNPTHFGPVTDQQFYSLLFALISLGAFFVMRRYLPPYKPGEMPPQPPEGEDAQAAAKSA